jgi:hypothetical protein
VTSPQLVQTNDSHIELIKASQNDENQGKDDVQRPNEYTKSICAEMRDTNPKDLHLLEPECRSTQAPTSQASALEEKLDPGIEQYLTEQKLNEKVAEHGIAVTPPGFTLPIGHEATNVENGGNPEQEEDLPSLWLAKDDSSGGIHTNPKQVTVGLGACQLNDAFDEAVQAMVAGSQPQVTSICHQIPLLQAQVTLEIITRQAPNEGFETKTPSHFSLQVEDTEQQHDTVILPQPSIKCNTSTHEAPLQQLQACNALPASIKEQQLVRHEMESTKDGGKENAHPEPPACQDLPRQVQEPPFKAPTVVQDDDTDYLHAFLTRAKAKKAAREGSPRKVDRPPPSPMTRSRAALLPLSTNPPSPKKANKHQQDTIYDADVAETNEAGSPCRRSERIRVPRPHKTPTVTTSTIPVRRSNGTEFIFLQNTDTVQITLATRTNTKRNKGEAVMPKMKLQALAQVQKSPSKSPKPRKGKEVSWKDEPTYFGMRDDAAEEAGEKRKADSKPSARKVRRLGAVNGTPAPKKMMVEDAAGVRTTAPRTRGKAKG